MKKLVCMLAVLAISFAATAKTVTYGWENGATVLGTFSTVLASNVNSPVYTGTHSLKLVDNYSGSATPQAYVAWVKGLNVGEVVTASFWTYDTTPSGSPSCRIWGHWNNSATDVMAYAGSASGNSTYGAGNGWTQLSYSWTVTSPNTGIVIEARTYSDALDTVWVDDLSVTAPNTATIVTPIPEPATMAFLALGGLLFARKK